MVMLAGFLVCMVVTGVIVLVCFMFGVFHPSSCVCFCKVIFWATASLSYSPVFVMCVIVWV